MFNFTPDLSPETRRPIAGSRPDKALFSLLSVATKKLEIRNYRLRRSD
jgi:hypothetical protein